MLYSIEIKCLPKDLPETIEASIDHLDVGDALHIGEIKWSDGVRSTLGDEVVVALVAKTRTALSEEAEGGAPAEGEEGAEAAEGAGEDGGGDASE